MAGYNPIGIGNQPNDGLGDGGRTGGAKINGMFQEIFYQGFVFDASGIKYNVKRSSFDAADLNPAVLKEDDRIFGYTNAQKTRYVDGIIKDPSLSIPGDFNDKTKFFKLIDKQQVS